MSHLSPLDAQSARIIILPQLRARVNQTAPDNYFLPINLKTLHYFSNVCIM